MPGQVGVPAALLRRDAPVGGGPGWPGFAYMADTVRSLLPFLERVGTVRPDEVDIDTLEERLCAEVAGQDGLQLLPAIVGASGLAPEPQRHSGESCPT